jgi:hypothetical protein
MKKTILVAALFLISVSAFTQNPSFEKFEFLLGDWRGEGSDYSCFGTNILIRRD